MNKKIKFMSASVLAAFAFAAAPVLAEESTTWVDNIESAELNLGQNTPAPAVVAVQEPAPAVKEAQEATKELANAQETLKQAEAKALEVFEESVKTGVAPSGPGTTQNVPQSVKEASDAAEAARKAVKEATAKVAEADKKRVVEFEKDVANAPVPSGTTGDYKLTKAVDKTLKANGMDGIRVTKDGSILVNGKPEAVKEAKAADKKEAKAASATAVNSSAKATQVSTAPVAAKKAAAKASLPQTGENSTLVAGVAGAGLIATAGLVAYKRKEN